jgi:hypothetical protein
MTPLPILRQVVPPKSTHELTLRSSERRRIASTTKAKRRIERIKRSKEYRENQNKNGNPNNKTKLSIDIASKRSAYSQTGEI